jgi:hypothetical protein
MEIFFIIFDFFQDLKSNEFWASVSSLKSEVAHKISLESSDGGNKKKRIQVKVNDKTIVDEL